MGTPCKSNLFFSRWQAADKMLQLPILEKVKELRRDGEI
jgi:hypothetical protein